MAPIKHVQLQPRHLDPSKIFPITFGIVAFLIIAGAIFWACVWPCIRIRYVNDRFPSRTRFRDEYNILHPMRGRLKSKIFRRKRPLSPTFPSHPAVLHDDSSQLLAPKLSIHKSRLKSPPLIHPRTVESIRMPTLWPRTRSTTLLDEVSTSDCLITPPRNCVMSGKGWSAEQSTTMPQTRTDYDRARSIASDHKFGDAKEYILALPEPLILRTQSPVSTAVPAALPDKTNLLSQSQLSSSNQTSSYAANSQHSSGLAKTLLRETDSTMTDGFEEEISEVSTFGEDRDEDDTSNYNLNTREQSIADLSEFESEQLGPPRPSHNQSITVLHRLKTYRSLTGARTIPPLTRAGTQTRPKTPVAEIRKFYARDASDGDDVSEMASGTETFSTKPWTATNDSMRLPSTAQTSIDATVSSSGLLPTPLQVRSSPKQNIKLGIQHLDKRNFKDTSCSDLAITLKAKGTMKPQHNPTAKGSRHLTATVCSSPQLLKLTSYIPVAVRKSRLVRPVNTMEDVRNAMFQEHNRSVSSIYSRDTRGFSIVHDHLTPAMENIASNDLKCPTLCTTPAQSPGHEQVPTASVALGYPTKPNAAINQKVEQWRIPVQAEALKVSSFSSLEQTLSKKDRRFPLLHELMIDEASSEVSAISTELNSVDAEAVRNSLPRLCIRESNGFGFHHTDNTSIEAVPMKPRVRPSSDSTVGLNEESYAPGGAQWI